MPVPLRAMSRKILLPMVLILALLAPATAQAYLLHRRLAAERCQRL
jgi:hypothetical protein